MYLKYLGGRTELVFKMKYLTGGPYYCDGPGAEFEVSDTDGKLILTNNPLAFREIQAPNIPNPQPAETEEQEPEMAEGNPRHVCTICGGEFKNAGGLKFHILKKHPDAETV